MIILFISYQNLVFSSSLKAINTCAQPSWLFVADTASLLESDHPFFSLHMHVFFIVCLFIFSVSFFDCLFVYIVCCRHSVFARDGSPIVFLLFCHSLDSNEVWLSVLNTHSKCSIFVQSIYLFPWQIHTINLLLRWAWYCSNILKWLCAQCASLKLIC